MDSSQSTSSSIAQLLHDLIMDERNAQTLRESAYSHDEIVQWLRQRRHEDALRKNALANLELLTKREREIFGLLANGCSSQEIADNLGISRRTVECFRLKMNKKLNISSTFDLVLMSIYTKI